MTELDEGIFGLSTLDNVERERERLAAVERYDVLDTPREEAFDRITRLAQKVFDVPIVVVNIIDAHRTWHKSCVGVTGEETSREHAFCTHTICQNDALIVADATKDPRFAQNPHVLKTPGVRFYAGVPLRTRDGHNIGSLCVVDAKPRAFTSEQTILLTDLGQMVMDELELRQLATTDSLTGAMSRRAFRDAAERTVALALRHNHDLSLISFDIDHFKSVNDTFGHPVGDKVLIRTVKTSRNHLRQTDYLGRMGGEEFVVLLPNTSRVGALDVAEKLRTAIGRQKFLLGEKPTHITASFGISSLGLAIRDLDSLLGRADEALYAAKSGGRNQCVTWQDPSASDKNPRRRVLKAGQILFNARTSIIDCTVRSLSEEGAGIDVISSTDVPSIFELGIRSENFQKKCRIVSQTEKHLEVAFC